MNRPITRLFTATALSVTLMMSSVASAQATPRTHAVLVGIADYPSSPLPRTDEDAERIASALRAHVPVAQLDMHLLLNSQATRGNVQRALAEVAANTSADDHVIFFFSGHGTPVADGGRLDEPDGVDEAIVLYDGNFSDDELSAALDAAKGKHLVAIDACFSGGFLFDVTNHKGRMGLFSSDEDLTSAVPEAAGGYLSLALAEALEGRADGAADGVSGQSRDGQLSALEIEVYVRERAKNLPAIHASDANDRTVGFQFIDIKRTDVAPSHIFLALQEGGGTLQGARERRVVVDTQDVALPGSMDFDAQPNFGDYQFVAGRTYIIETYDLIGATDTVLELRESSSPTHADASDRIVAENDDADGLASRVRYTPSEDGAFYGHVRPYDESTGGTFSLRIVECAEADTLDRKSVV